MNSPCFQLADMADQDDRIQDGNAEGAMNPMMAEMLSGNPCSHNARMPPDDRKGI